MTTGPARRIRSTRAKKETARDAKDNPRKDPERIAMAGSLVKELTQISASNATLTVAFGRGEDGRDVLIPLVDWQLFGNRGPTGNDSSEEQVGQELFSNLLPLENVAFLLQDIASDLREAVRLLVSQSKGGIVPIDDRMRYASKMLNLAQENLSAASEQLITELVGPDMP